MDIILKIAGLGILSYFVCLILKKSDKDELASIVTIMVLTIVMLMLLDMLSGLFENIKSVFGLY